MSPESNRLILGALGSIATGYYMLKGMHKTESTGVDMESKVYQGKLGFQDFYGGDMVKLKFN